MLALKEFGAHGFHGARIEAIARRARVPRGLIAYYFSTKEGLFQPLARNRADAIERTQHRVGSGPEYPLRGRSACLRRVVPQPIGST